MLIVVFRGMCSCPVLQMRKLRLWKVKQFPGLFREWQNWDSRWGLTTLRLVMLTSSAPGGGHRCIVRNMHMHTHVHTHMCTLYTDAISIKESTAQPRASATWKYTGLVLCCPFPCPAAPHPCNVSENGFQRSPPPPPPPRASPPSCALSEPLALRPPLCPASPAPNRLKWTDVTRCGPFLHLELALPWEQFCH